MQQLETYIGAADKLFDADGKLANDEMRKPLQHFMTVTSTQKRIIRTGYSRRRTMATPFRTMTSGSSVHEGRPLATSRMVLSIG